MRDTRSKNPFVILLAILFLTVPSTSAMAEVKGTYLYTLSDFTGRIPYNWARVFVDKERSETYVLYQNSLKVFNEFGMEIYRFGEDLDLGHIVDGAVDRNGDILLLFHKENHSGIFRCDYRGELKSRIDLKDLPPEFSEFSPNRMVYRDGELYLVSLNKMKLIMTDIQGHFKKGYDIFPLLQLEEKDRDGTDMVGFTVDRDGNILFTIPTLFKAFKLSPDGKVEWFGKPGGSPGKFNVVAGIERDSRGNYIVVDKLKSAVMVFDKKFNFLIQFGYRGLTPGNLIAPDAIAIDNQDRIYVTQGRNRGVSVFRLTHN